MHLYPRSKFVDYAYYMRGVTEFYEGWPFIQRHLNIDRGQRDLTSARKSFSHFNDLLMRFPHSHYAPDVRRRMVYLREIIAKQELVIATYYLHRHAYVAAANRANYIIKHFQHAPSVIEALKVLVQAYQAMGMKDMAASTENILKRSYPESV